MPDPERERLVRAVDRAELNLTRAKRSDWWLGEYLDARDEARAALAAYDKEHPHD